MRLSLSSYPLTIAHGAAANSHRQPFNPEMPLHPTSHIILQICSQSINWKYWTINNWTKLFFSDMSDMKIFEMKSDWKLWQDLTIISMDVGRIFWNPLCHRVSPFFNPTTTISPVLSLWHVSVEGLWYQQEIEQTNSITHGCRPGYWAKILWYSPISLKIHP